MLHARTHWGSSANKGKSILNKVVVDANYKNEYFVFKKSQSGEGLHAIVSSITNIHFSILVYCQPIRKIELHITISFSSK